MFFKRTARYAAVLALVCAVALADQRLLKANGATAAFTFLIVVLAVATRLGLAESILASIASMLAYNFFFLPPIGTLTISDPQNWVALLAFLLTAITVSHFSARARREARESFAAQQEIRRLYEFSRALMLGSETRPLAMEAVNQLALLFNVSDVLLYESAGGSQSAYKESESALRRERLEEVAQTGTEWRSEAEGLAIVPVELGGQRMGSLGVADAQKVSSVALHAVSQLIAIAMERERVQLSVSRMEASRENERLKSTLLDALAHEFKTPLTSLKAATSMLLTRETTDTLQEELLTVIDEEADRMTRLVTDSIELARFGSGPVKLDKKAWPLEELIRAALAQLQPQLEERSLDVRLEDDLHVACDRPLLELALRQILGNAVKYSPAGSLIRAVARTSSRMVEVRIVNEGAPIPKAEQKRVFEKFYRGSGVRGRIAGTGLGLSITRDIIEAHRGKVWVESVPAEPISICFEIPALLREGNLSQ